MILGHLSIKQDDKVICKVNLYSNTDNNRENLIDKIKNKISSSRK